MRWWLLFLLIVLLFIVHLHWGSVFIPPKQILTIISGGRADNPAWRDLILFYRLPKALTALLAGSALSLSGLLMQTFFRNPLAGPDVLGLTSGASLFVALLVMAGSILPIPE
ncbi:MAG: iron ABC transporter permease, partial [Cyclobacteriaceae bacterium]|nr:iron ABC transporter permease [Cyclobacteriaceae bacterium]